MQGNLSIERMCQLAQVSGAGFYRSLAEQTPVEEEMEVRAAIQRIALEHRRRYGYRRIAAELQAEPRLRVAELARRIGLSGPATADRLRRLEETGTLSYRADVDPRALGYTLFAIIRISPSGGGLRLIPGIALGQGVQRGGQPDQPFGLVPE